MPDDRGLEFHHLPCELTSVEKMAKAELLCKAMNERQGLAEQKKDTVAAFNESIVKLGKTIDRLVAELSDGMENREIECVWEFDWDADKKNLIRTDTGKTVRSEKITQEERQAKL